MAVVIETTLGDLTVDLFLDRRPQTCLNFLKLSQTGDPTGEGSGGMSVWGIIDGPEKRFFSGEKMPKIRHTDIGLLSMVGTGDMIGSQFFFTLGENLDSLDGSHCVIGIVTEGHEVLRKLNEVICDETHRPYQDVRITHTVVLEDPFDDPKGLVVPSRSPSPSAERLAGGRLAPDEEIDESKGKSAAELQELIAEREAKARATILEIVGDLPDADVAPPENVLFVCKLNPVTTDDDLELIFSRFGKINCCEVIRDKKTGNSLQYAFIEFAEQKSCEDAYFKMDNVLIDDRRIHVDFSQSVSKVKWLGKGRGVKHIHENSTNKQAYESSKHRKSNSRERDRESHKEISHYRDRNMQDKHKFDHESSRDYEHRHRLKEKEHRDKHSDVHSRNYETKHSKSDKNKEAGESHSKRSMRHETGSRKRCELEEKVDSHERSRHHKYDESEKVSSQHKNDGKYEENEKASEKKYKHEKEEKSVEKSRNNKYDEPEMISKQHKKDTYKKRYQEEDESNETNLPQKKRLRDDRDASNSDKNKYGDVSKRVGMKEDRGNLSNQTKSRDRRKRSYDSYAEKSDRYLQNKNNHENGKSSIDRENMQNHSLSSSRRHEKNPRKPIVIEDKYKLKGKRLQTPRTPSPDLEKRMKDLKDSKKSRKDVKKGSGKQQSKKRRRSPSSSDSSDSSSSTSSSSSDGRKKKAKGTNKKKRKYTSSSSSSTSSDSSSSSSDSDSSSSSTSSSSSSPKRKKKTKKVTKVVKKCRK